MRWGRERARKRARKGDNNYANMPIKRMVTVIIKKKVKTAYPGKTSLQAMDFL